MRSSILALLALTCAFSFSAMLPSEAQAYTSWSAGSAYSYQGGADRQCGYVQYDARGNSYQTCTERMWSSWYGTQWGNVWVSDGYGGRWISRQETRTWWSFQIQTVQYVNGYRRY